MENTISAANIYLNIQKQNIAYVQVAQGFTYTYKCMSIRGPCWTAGSDFSIFSGSGS